jgi:hypothetical protein
MMAVGNAMGIALIGSLFFGMIGTSAASNIGNHFNGSNVKIHHYIESISMLLVVHAVTIVMTVICC